MMIMLTMISAITGAGLSTESRSVGPEQS